MPSELLSRWACIHEEINQLRIKPQLMVVSKTQPCEIIYPLIDAGQILFGENRVQEAQKKWTNLKKTYPQCLVHLIGPLQTNKVQEALNIFDGFQTLDRPKLVEKIALYLPQIQKPITFFIQINIGYEPQKAGVRPENLSHLWDLCHRLNVPIDGFMCIPPEGINPEPYFKSMAEYQRCYGVKHLSMGMSSDYKLAMTMGSTLLRVGSSIFGQNS